MTQPNFPGVATEPAPEFGFWSLAARRKVSLPVGFVFHGASVIQGGALLVGCVSSGVRTRGTRKGQPLYDGPKQKVLVSDTERDAEEARYEADTGRCRECFGARQVVVSVSTAGVTRRPCPRCGGSGKAPEADHE